MKKLEKDIKMIAKFMGIKTENSGVPNYKNSWDALMPVIYKIKQLILVDTSKTEQIDWYLTGGILRHTYSSVVDFIKWYNIIHKL